MLVGVIVQDVEVGLNISSTPPFTMMETLLMVMVEVCLGIIPPPLPPTIQLCLIYHWVLIFMVVTEIEIALIPANFLHITMVEYIFPTQSFLNHIFQGVVKDKIHIKIILTILVQACHHTLIQVCNNIIIATCHLILIQE